MSREPAWVCRQCAIARGAKMPSSHIATFHIGVCGICNIEKQVTQPRDYGKDRIKLTIGS